jgi:hypothetical protein
MGNLRAGVRGGSCSWVLHHLLTRRSWGWTKQAALQKQPEGGPSTVVMRTLEV